MPLPWNVYPPRTLAAVLGLLLMSLAALPYESEEARFQNQLQDWWVLLDEKRKGALSWAALFTQKVARITSRCLDILFGERLFSIRTVAVSIVLSLASAYLALFLLLP